MHASPRGWSGPGGRPVHHLHVMTAGVKKFSNEWSILILVSRTKTQRLQSDVIMHRFALRANGSECFLPFYCTQPQMTYQNPLVTAFSSL